MNRSRLHMPWARPCDLYSAPGSLILKLNLGEAPAAIPTALDVRSGATQPASRTGLTTVDRVLNHFSDRIQITRVHAAAATLRLPGRSHTGFDDLEHALGLSRTFRVDADHSCCIEDLVDALRQLSTVEESSPQYLITLPLAVPAPIELDSNLAWGPRLMINAPEAMAYEPGDRAVIAAVVDTGVVLENSELVDRLRPGVDTVQLGSSALAAGIELLGDRSEMDTSPDDEVGHGTSCAAIIAATGQHIPPGLAGECGLLPVRSLGAARFPGKKEAVGIGALSDIDAGVKLAIDLGARVINMSFGTQQSALDPNDPQPHHDVVHYGLSRGCVMVAASGNSGKEEDFLPAAFPGVIAVGAVRPDGTPASFSTSGAHVALCAPGERVVTAGLNGYQMVSGTSFAAPFVAAVAALLLSRAMRRSQPMDGLTVKRLLIASARPWPAGERLEAYTGHGAGILDAYAALRSLDQEIDREGFAARNLLSIR